MHRTCNAASLSSCRCIFLSFSPRLLRSLSSCLCLCSRASDFCTKSVELFLLFLVLCLALELLESTPFGLFCSNLSGTTGLHRHVRGASEQGMAWCEQVKAWTESVSEASERDEQVRA
jgi:hypothetical protein